MATASHAVRAHLIRKVSASTDIGKTLRKAVRALSDARIPSLVVGGYAVQEHGYARFTSYVDIVVSSVADARARLSISGFRENPGSSMTLTDRVTKVEVDLLPGGGTFGPGPLYLPMPTSLGIEPAIASLKTLLEIKLSSYIGSPISRLRDLGDVVELVKANELPRDYALASSVAETYATVWDGLEAERRR